MFRAIRTAAAEVRVRWQIETICWHGASKICEKHFAKALLNRTAVQMFRVHFSSGSYFFLAERFVLVLVRGSSTNLQLGCNTVNCRNSTENSWTNHGQKECVVCVAKEVECCDLSPPLLPSLWKGQAADTRTGVTLGFAGKGKRRKETDILKTSRRKSKFSGLCLEKFTRSGTT